MMDNIGFGMLVKVLADGPHRGRLGRVVRRSPLEERPLADGEVFVAVFDDPSGDGYRGTYPYPKSKLTPYTNTD